VQTFFLPIATKLLGYGARLPPVSKFGTVKVSGSSMAPTYRDGDWLLVSWFPAGLTPLVGDRILGKVVVVERDERPGIFLVKRLQKSHGGIYWVQGDNSESTDSRTWGWIPANEVVGVVLFRYKRSRVR
jgi:signal peptidase I